MGFSKIDGNLLNAVSSVHVIVLSYLISLAPDQTHLCGPSRLRGALFGLPLGTNKWTRYSIFALSSGGNALVQGLSGAMVSINATKTSNWSLGLTMVVIGSNSGAIAGQQLFRSSDGPRYTRLFLAILLLYAASVPITLLLIWIYRRGNKTSKRELGAIENLDREKRFDI